MDKLILALLHFRNSWLALDDAWSDARYSENEKNAALVDEASLENFPFEDSFHLEMRRVFKWIDAFRNRLEESPELNFKPTDLSQELYHAIFNMLDKDPKFSGMRAGYIATMLEGKFLEILKKD